MTIIFGIVAVLEGIAIAALVMRASRHRKELRRFAAIQDVERYKLECENAAALAVAQQRQIVAESAQATAELNKQKTTVAQYQKLLGNLKTAADLKQRIEADTHRARQIATTLQGLQRASELQEYIRRQQAAIQQHQAHLNSLGQAIGLAGNAAEIAAQITYFQNTLAVLKSEVQSVEEARELQEFGFYQPRYNFNSAEDYELRLDLVRNRQKKMLSARSACVCSTEWTVDGDKREGRRMSDQQIKLMLRAFNGESDAAIGKVRYNNVVALEKRIGKAFEQINKLGETQRTSLAFEYFQLKLEELYLSHEYQVKREEEREEQRLHRERIKEEARVAAEIERAQEEAEREEARTAKALEKARQELEQKAGQQTEKLAALVAKLETELKDAIDRKAKAIARAQLTRSGHVYILSNIGSFGENIYKIGMSRRLVPQERVDELGSASVPFEFDVHAMIYSEDAPTLENALHRHFALRRVNLVNHRKEFFRVTLDEIRAAVAQHFGQVTFMLAPEAKHYRQTMAMLREKPAAAELQIA